MATLKSLQRPQIIDITASVIRVAHPDISKNLQTQLRSQVLAAADSCSVADNNGLVNADELLIGRPGIGLTETVAIDDTVTRGQTVPIAATLKFSHEVDSPVTKIFEKSITVYGSATDGGSLTAIRATGAAVSIQWDNEYTEIPLITTDTAYAYYVVKFYDGVTQSDASQYIPATGLPANSAEKILQEALIISNSGKLDELITRRDCVNWVDKAQQEMTFFTFQDPISGRLVQKDWQAEEYTDEDSLTAVVNDNRVSLSGLTHEPKHFSGKAFIAVRFGPYGPLDKKEPKDIRAMFDGNVRTTVKTQATAGDTSLVIVSNIELPDSGQVYVGDDLVTYTAKSGTDTLTGVPASGDGSITATRAVGVAVWYGKSPGLPIEWAIDGDEIIFDKPVSDDYDGYKVKVDYFRKLPKITEACDNTLIVDYDIMYLSVAEKIENRKKNPDEAAKFRKMFRDQLLERAIANESATPESYKYYKFEET